MADTPNGLVGGLSHMSARELESTLLLTAPQLFGEELLTVLPFLALLQLAHTHFGLVRKKAVVIAWIASARLELLRHERALAPRRRIALKLRSH